MFLPFIKYTTTFFHSSENSCLLLKHAEHFFIYFLTDRTKIKDLYRDFVALTESFCLQMYTACAVKDGHIIAHLRES